MIKLLHSMKENTSYIGGCGIEVKKKSSCFHWMGYLFKGLGDTFNCWVLLKMANSFHVVRLLPAVVVVSRGVSQLF